MGRRVRKAGLIGVIGGLTILFGSGFSLAPATAAVPNVQVVVGLSSTAVHASSVLGGLPGSTPRGLPADRFTLSVPEGEVPGVLNRLRSSTAVSYADVPQAVHAAAVTPNDPCYRGPCPALNPEPFDESGATVAASQPNLAAVDAPGAWALSTGSPSVKVAVLDTGADLTTPDLAGQVIAGPDVCEQAGESGCGTTPTVSGDQSGHGSHVAGIVDAHTNNGTGIASLGWNTRVEAIQVLDNQGNGNTTDVATGIYDAVAAGDRVINLSLSNDSCAANPNDCGPDPDEEAAVEFAIAHNVVVVAAAGNDGQMGNGPTFPASYPGVISVAAENNAGAIEPFSESGTAADIAAPGVDVLSTWNNGGYAVLTGTSMAAPAVSAAAALLIAAHPSLTASQVSSLLITTAKPITGGASISGGDLDAAAALNAARSGAVSTPGYDVVGATGMVTSFGLAPEFGSVTTPLNRPVVGMSDTPDGGGYWLVASDGGIFTFGDARFFGSTGAIRLNKPIVGMASTPDGRGYWLVASDGGVFSFGDARFFGSTGAIRLNKPVVGMASTPDGRGYWMAASDGGIFSFGDARFFGSTGNLALVRPVVGMARTSDGQGYWMVASDGGIFTFGDARFFGSAASSAQPAPIVGMAT